MKLKALLLEVIMLAVLSAMVKLSLFNDINLCVYRVLHVDSYAIYIFSETASIAAFVAIIAAPILMDLARQRKVGSFSQGLVIAIVINTVFVYALKACLQVYRPGALHTDAPTEVLGVDVYGYPSGHTARAFTLATYLSIRLEMKKVAVAVFLWALGVALSRLLLGVHWLSDVLGGALVGTLSAHVANLVMKHIAR
uniref:Phosphatase PAP2 family protein n=1 Tax=Ignisphaera aggregans TaxID=334771 RepID=A0A7J3Z611_9CREN